MHRYRNINKYAAGLVLVCFLTALTGVSALAGHDCCGNCAEDMAHNPASQQPVMVADGCCPVEIPAQPACACSFQSSGEQTPQTYARTHAGPTGDDQQIQVGILFSAKDIAQQQPGCGPGSPHVDIRLRLGPIFLTNQSFLC